MHTLVKYKCKEGKKYHSQMKTQFCHRSIRMQTTKAYMTAVIKIIISVFKEDTFV